VTTWRAAEPEDAVRIGVLGSVLVLLRGAAMVLILIPGLLILLAIRAVERPLCGLSRPASPEVTRVVSRLCLAVIGLDYSVSGRPMRDRGGVVANHASWLDIFVLNACQTVYFVAKSEVAGWALIGWLARATGTVFIARDPREAKAQQALFEARLRAGHKLLFFPEGTSTDGMRVLPFKSTLFAGFYSHGLDHIMKIQPVTVIYRAPPARGERFYGWWGDMSFTRHLVKVLATPRQGAVRVLFHDPVEVEDFPTRKELCLACETTVRAPLKAELGARYRED